MLNPEDLEIGAVYHVNGLYFEAAVWTGVKFKGPAEVSKQLVFREEEPYWNGLPLGTCTPVERISNVVLNKPFDGINLLRALKALSDYIWEKK